MPPIGFVVLTHSNPNQVGRLIGCLNAVYGHPPIVLHHDFSQCPAEFSLPPNVRIVRPSVVTRWGHVSLVRATLAGLAMLYSDAKPKWFALLSGACYPTKRAEEVLARLERGAYDAYIHHELIEPLTPRRGFHDVCYWRYFRWHVPLPRGIKGVERRYRLIPTPRFLTSLSPYCRREFQCYAGAQWFTARDHVAEFILRWEEDNPWLAKYLRYRPSPDETFFQSILCNAHRFHLSSNYYRYVDWPEGGSHPKVLGPNDFPNIVNSSAHFARKFAPDSPVLDLLDDHLGINSGDCPTEPENDGRIVSSSDSEKVLEDSKAPDKKIGKISIIIPTYQRAALLSKTLESLATQTDANFEVIVVCDGDDPKTRGLAESQTTWFQLKWVFAAETSGIAVARNLGTAAANGEILLFLDDDATADPKWIEMHRKGHEAESSDRLIMVLGRTVHVYDRAPHSHTERLLREERDRRDEKYATVLGTPDSCSPEVLAMYGVCGFNCSIDRGVFLESGGFDGRMRPTQEEIELGLRLHAKGVETVVESRAILYHHDPKDLVADTRSYWKNASRLGMYRLAHKGQRCAQLLGFRRMRTLNPARWFFQALSWYHPDLMRGGASLCRGLCDRTGSRWSLRQWQRLESAADFFQPLRSEGIEPKELRRLIGPPLLVLALHNIATAISSDERRYHISSGRLRRLLGLLDLLKFRCVSAAKGLSSPARHDYVLTIDDGFEDLYTELMPLVEPYRLKPLLFLVVDQLGGFNVWESPMGYRRRKLLSIEQVREMHRYGVEFGSHTCTHPWLPSLSDRDLRREVTESKQKLEDLLGSEVTSFAYPYGGANIRVRAMVARAGYQRAFSVSPGLSFWDDPFWVKRVEVGESDALFGLLMKVITGKSPSQHAFEQLSRLRKSTENVLNHI